MTTVAQRYKIVININEQADGIITTEEYLGETKYGDYEIHWVSDEQYMSRLKDNVPCQQSGMADKKMIAIVDYGAGNLRSVANAIAKLGCLPRITSHPSEVLDAQAVFLPGVGAAADTMANLNKLGLASPIRQLITENRPFFGVCIGLQILFTGTEEGGWHECLGVIPGRVRKLPSGLKIPHMGWNQVKQRVSHPVFAGIPDEANFYFVHSYYGEPDDKSLVAGETYYGIPICSVIARGNLVATQFHPEKSGEFGLRMYANFIKLAMAAEI